MLDSTPVPLQAMLWPLLGAALCASLGRFLPRWLSRTAAVAASLASLGLLWQLRSAPAAAVHFDWSPLGLFRMGPALALDALSLLVGIALAGATASAVLGIRIPTQRSWPAWLLVGLTGGLLTAMAANLVTLAMGSALLDLALVGMAVVGVEAGEQRQRAAVWVCVTGLASTGLLFWAALEMDAVVGTGSLLSNRIPASAVTLIGLSGLLRLMLAPLHPRRLDAPALAVSYLVPAGTGIYLLARAQGLAPQMAGQPWTLTVAAVALLAGGWTAWLGSHRPSQPSPAEAWTGLAMHQAGLALAFVVLFPGTVPWPLLSLLPALGILAIWWDASQESQPAQWPRRLAALEQALREGWRRARAWGHTQVPASLRQRGNELRLPVRTLWPAIALASLAGLPLTLGAVSRWNLVGRVLQDARAPFLFAALLADVLLAAGLWRLFRRACRQSHERPPGPAATLAMAGLAVLLILMGAAPRSGAIVGEAGIAAPPSVSSWGLGLILALPSILGLWLARVSRSATGALDRLHRLANPAWLYRTLAWCGQRLVSAAYWVGRVGEGEGWWGWALIILALGSLVLAAR